MTEIELKAHVADPAETERIVRSFASFDRHIQKSDAYWKRENTESTAKPESGMARKPAVPLFAAITVVTFLASAAAAVSVIAGASRSTVMLFCLGASALVAVTSILARKNPQTASRLSPAENSEAAPNGLKVRIREESLGEGNSSTLVTYKRKELQGDIEVNDEREFSIDDRAAFESLIGDLGFAAYIRKEKDTKSFTYRAPGGHEMTIELSLVAGLGWFIEIEILADSPTAEETKRAQNTLRETLARCGIPESAIERRYYTEMLEESDGASTGTDASTARPFRPKK